MFPLLSKHRLGAFSMLVGLAATGCGSPAAPPAEQQAAVEPPPPAYPIAVEQAEPTAQRASQPARAVELTESERFDCIVQALKPFHRLLGTWRGTTQKDYSGFKAIENESWLWDFTTEPRQPAIVFSSDDSPYLRSGRLTYLVDPGVFQFTAVDTKSNKRVFEVAVPDFRDSNSKRPRDSYVVQVGTVAARVFEDDDHPIDLACAPLQFREVSPEAESDAWCLTFACQTDGDLAIEFARLEGEDTNWVDTIVARREPGSAPPVPDTLQTASPCIVSQGPATIEVQHDGHSYWVCCPQCRDAFEKEPNRWIRAGRTDE